MPFWKSAVPMLLTCVVACFATAPAPVVAPLTSAKPPAPPAPAFRWSDAAYAALPSEAQTAFQQILDIDNVDAELLSGAAFLQTNRERQAQGLKPLAYLPDCRIAAQRYSDDMVHKNFYFPDHGHIDPKLKTPQQRMEAAGLRNATAWGENIAVTFAWVYKAGQPVFVPQHAGEPFRDEAGQPLRKHTYATFAEALVTQWMNSPHHRANILDRDWTHFGVACTPFTETDGFAKLKCTQDFTRL